MKQKNDKCVISIILWFFALIALSFGFRFLLGEPFSGVGLIDDFSLLCLTISLWSLSLYFNKALGIIMMLLCMLFFNSIYLSSSLTFEFFHDYITVDLIQSALLAVDAQSSVLALLSKKQLILLLPSLLLVLSLFYLPKKSKTYLNLCGSALLLGSFSVGYVVYAKAESFIAAQTNPVMHLVYQWGNRVLATEIDINKLDMHSLLNIPKTATYPDKSYPLFKTIRTSTAQSAKSANVVVFMMESLRGLELGVAADDSLATPNLRRMATEGLFFPNIYFSSTQTARGEIASLCSVLPHFIGGQIYSQYPQLSTICLPEILSQHGYSTHWFHGYRLNYSNNDVFLSAHGYQDLHGMKKMLKAGYSEKVGWGISDADVLNYGLEILDKQTTPFFAEFLTLSNHHPFDNDFGIEFPHAEQFQDEEPMYQNYLKGMHYTDHTINAFIEKSRHKPWFDNTIFVFVGDHGINLFPNKANTKPTTDIEKREIYFRSGLIIWSPKQLQAKTYQTLGSQIDIAPTIMDLLQITPYQNTFAGVSLLSDLDNQQRFAIMLNDNIWNFRQGNTYCYALGQSCYEEMFPRCPPNVKPEFKGHTCFSTDEDLLSKPIEEIKLHPVDFDVEIRLLNKANTMLKVNNFLLKNNLFSPQ